MSLRLSPTPWRISPVHRAVTEAGHIKRRNARYTQGYTYGVGAPTSAPPEVTQRPSGEPNAAYPQQPRPPFVPPPHICPTFSSASESEPDSGNQNSSMQLDEQRGQRLLNDLATLPTFITDSIDRVAKEIRRYEKHLYKSKQISIYHLREAIQPLDEELLSLHISIDSVQDYHEWPGGTPDAVMCRACVTAKQVVLYWAKRHAQVRNATHNACHEAEMRGLGKGCTILTARWQGTAEGVVLGEIPCTAPHIVPPPLGPQYRHTVPSEAAETPIKTEGKTIPKRERITPERDGPTMPRRKTPPPKKKKVIPKVEEVDDEA